MSRLASLALALFVTAGGCEGSADPEAPSEPSAATGSQQTGSVGVVEGVVRFAEGATIPRYTTEEVGRTADRPEMPPGCPSPQAADRDVFRLGEGRGIAGLMVAARGDRETFFAALPDTRPPVTRPLEIRGCRLEPSMVVATRGDSLRISNRDDYPFLPKVGRTPLIRTVLPGGSQTTELEQGGVVPVTCGFAAPCGRAEVVVLYHPVHTVTGEGGRFRIENVPADQDVQIAAWHPSFTGRLERATATVNVGVGETAQLELVVRPAEPAEPAEPAPSSPPSASAAD